MSRRRWASPRGIATFAEDRLALLAAETARGGHVGRQTQRRFEVLRDHHRVEQVPAGLEFDQHVDTGVGTTRATDAGSEVPEAHYAHPAHPAQPVGQRECWGDAVVKTPRPAATGRLGPPLKNPAQKAKDSPS